MHHKILKIALDVPLNRLFDYLCDDAPAMVGQRVLVSFGQRKQIGIIVKTATQA